MKNTLLIGAGGAFGAITRYLISNLFQKDFNFPIGTLVVNVTGSFILGTLLYSLSATKIISDDLKYFLGIGFIGAFTTMSTFAFESFRLIEVSEFLFFGVNIIANLFFSIAAIYIAREFVFLLFR